MTVIGLMRHRLAIEVLNQQPDESELSYLPVAIIWASLEPLNKAGWIVGGNELNITHRITIRWRDDLTNLHRFTKGSRVFVIKAIVDPDEKRLNLHALVEEIR